MSYYCKCALCGKILEVKPEDDARIEFDFIEQVIRYFCVDCHSENKMAILTSNKLKDRPLPKTSFMRA